MKKILIFGDSHATFFEAGDEQINYLNCLKDYKIDVLKIPGATILGFGRRESTLNSWKILTEKIESYEPDFICFALGQVDIELGYYYKIVIKGEKLDPYEYFNTLAEKYVTYIYDFCEKNKIPHNKIIIKGINISVLTESRQKAVSYTQRIIAENINNKEDFTRYKKILFAKLPSNVTRYDYHQFFNQSIQLFLKTGTRYFDLNDVFSDETRYGHCKREFIPATNDHHIINSVSTRDLHINRLIKALH